jgi:ABC-type uncharacterized transport system involved in gliding motility auxiliary subunit
MLLEVSLKSRDLNMSAVQCFFLIVKLSVQVSVLLLSINQKVSLIINFLSESRYHRNICLNSALVVILHSPFIISYPVEVLFQVQKLVLQLFVLSFSLSQLIGFLSQLRNKSIFIVLIHLVVMKFSFWTLRHICYVYEIFQFIFNFINKISS